LADDASSVLHKPAWVNPVEGIITSMSGLRKNPVTGKTEFHDGIDIACPVGTNVFATRDGTVTAAGWSPSFGYYIRLEFNGGYTAFYAHLERILVPVREIVTQGQVIAYSGNTGRSTGPHLHYSLFRDGQHVNPIAYVSLPARNERAFADGHD
jgi:murein DD-endopeptidase MepM/ murein hydrolase activator NlpD